MISFSELNIIGLTGMSGAGKSTVAGAFSENNFFVIDCDSEAKRVIANPPCSQAVIEAFPEAFDSSGEFNRIKMGRLVFSNQENLLRYERIVFPFIIYSVIQTIFQLAEKGEKNFLLDAPTLYQSGADDLCGKVIAVTAARELCVFRITERDGISEDDALKRLNAQPDPDFYKKRADRFIVNNHTEAELIKNTKEIITEMKWQ